MKRRLLVVVAVALALRVGYLVHVTSHPGFVWDDPDSYMAHGLALAGGEEGGWRFRFEAVEHAVEGRRYALPPLYPVFLSLFAIFPGYPFTAQLGQAVLGGLAAGMVLLLATRLHSERAGLIAGLAYAFWLPNVIAVWSTMQETLFVPLTLLGFVLLFRAHDAGEKRKVLAGLFPGLVFGLATLTRSMPFYYLPFAAVLLWRRGFRLAAGLVAGFVAVTLPYSLALSIHLGEPTFVENHGGLRIVTQYGEGAGARPPGTLGTAVTLVRAFVESPTELTSEWWETFRSLLHVNGGRLLQLYLGSETRWGACLSKLAAHAFGDGLFIAALLLAPFGLVLCRRSDLGLYLLLWILVTLGLTTLSGFGGSRLRAPTEPCLAVLAAVVLAGGYRSMASRWDRAALAMASAVSVLLATVVVPQVPSSLRARADYGVYWPLESPTKRAPMTGEAGFNVLAVNEQVVFYVRPRNPGGATRVEVELDGEPVDSVVVDRQEHRFVFPWPRLELVPVELVASDASTNEPVRMLVVVPRR